MKLTNALRNRDKQEVEGEATRPGPVFRPDVDILERADAYLIYADLPGADEHSVNVRLDRGTLTLDAQLATFPGEEWNPLHAEYRFGSYHREFRISEDIADGDVSAKVSNGVLEVLLPKSAERQPRAIPVQTA